MANQCRGLVFTGAAKTEKGLAQHLHTARSPSAGAGAVPVFIWSYCWREDGHSCIHSTYKVYAAYLLDSTNHCALIRQNIKADSTRSFKTIFVNEWIQWGDLSELAISEESFLPPLMVKGE